MKFRGTLIAIVLIILLVIISKFGFGESLTRKETIVEPTEEVTLGVLENTAFGVLPTQN